MENPTTTTQIAYQDSPISSRPSTLQSQSQPQSQSQSQPQSNQDSPSSSISTIKPLPALPHQTSPPTYEPYRDDPSDTSYRDDPSNSSSPTPQPQQPRQQRPYTDISPPLTPIPTPLADDENIPLAHLLLTPNPYPHEAPPSYAVAIRQTHSRRDTLIQYIPSDDHAGFRNTVLRNVVVDVDEETGEVVGRTDDVRHAVEKVVAMFVVAIILLVLSGVLMWLALGSGIGR
ncbi:hypothetical protein DE146DRAFT_648462 [Phaeosphaeria sp. MPI-PUGE-AT-0046c]|nr:hypothetical protein DE146DRAFT_648462 [Phaeosphaeria sp. MPI-PUGE-AT-0046c]